MPFLSLPREIRNYIYFFVIHLERDPPSPGDKSISTNYQIKERDLEYDFCDIYYEVAPFAWPYTSLSRTSRQVRTEVREAVIALRNAETITYSLDLMVDGTHLYPTWLSVPVPTKHIAELRVDFRRASTSQQRWIGCGGVGPMIRNLGRLLSRFVAHGPSFFPGAGPQPECQFEVLSVRVVDKEIREHWEAREISEEDFSGLMACANLLSDYDVLGTKARSMKLQHGDTVAQVPIPGRTPRDEDLAFWSAYGWYRPSPSFSDENGSACQQTKVQIDEPTINETGQN